MGTQVRPLALLSWLRIGIVVSYGVGCRRGSDATLLWFRLDPLAWKLPYAAGAALKKVIKVKIMYAFPLCFIWLRMWCHRSCGSNSIPGPGTSMCYDCGKKKCKYNIFNEEQLHVKN